MLSWSRDIRVLVCAFGMLIGAFGASCEGSPGPKPMAGAILRDGGLVVFGAPCDDDRLESIAVIDAEAADESRPLWKVSDPEPDADAYYFPVSQTPPSSPYRLDFALDSPIPDDRSWPSSSRRRSTRDRFDSRSVSSKRG